MSSNDDDKLGGDAPGFPPFEPDPATVELAAALRNAPEVEREAVRRTVRIVLQCHFAELANGRDLWPGDPNEDGERGHYFPSDALRDLSIGESAVLDHVDQVADRVLALVPGREQAH